MNRCSEPLNQEEGEIMKEEPKRFTISVSAELFERLNALQQQTCPQSSRNEMLVTLIRKGLEAANGGVSLSKAQEKKE